MGQTGGLAVHNNMQPYLLALFSLLNMFFIWRGRNAILAGNWIKHRNFMVVSLALWGGTLAFFSWFLWSTKLWRLIATQTLFMVYVALALVASAMLAVTLWRVVKHLLLPHKLLARQTIIVWQLACMAGVVLYIMLGFSFMI